MQNSELPTLLPLPFAADGGKRAIPEESQIGVEDGRASLTDGFPPLTRIPLSSGGIPPSGLDMNGILFEISAISRWANAGGGYPYDATFATDPNVGGYPKGAKLLNSDGTGYWLNTSENNATDPDAAGAGWLPDFSSQSSAITMSNANVTLTPSQYSKRILVITGTLTANVNLIFPAIMCDWYVVDKTSGNYFITAKTASDDGVIVSKYSPFPVICDGYSTYTINTKIATFEQFGAKGGGVVDDTSAIIKALNSGATAIYGYANAYKISGNLIIPDYISMIGGGQLATSLIVSSDIVAVTVKAFCTLKGFKIYPSVTHTKNLIEVGSNVLDGGRSVLSDLFVTGAGNDGIQVRNGNLGNINNVATVSNTRDGINFSTDTIDNNAWTLSGFIDTRGNGRDGLHYSAGSSATDLYAPKSQSANLVIAQQNGRYGIYSGSRSNVIVCYTEANATKDVYLDTYAYGNMVTMVEGYVTDVGKANVVSTMSADADYYRAFKGKVRFQGGSGNGLRIDSSDGLAGALDIEKTALREFSFKAANSSATQKIKITHEDYPTQKTNLQVDGDYIVGPSTGGIDFTATKTGPATTNAKLGYYEEGTWTPTLVFGSDSTGITYTVRQGKYTRVGRQVTIRFEVWLSNKGSSTGEVSITGLPFSAGELNSMAVYLYSGFSATYKAGIAYLNGTTINEIAANGTSAFTDANFTNSSRFWATCTYQI